MATKKKGGVLVKAGKLTEMGTKIMKGKVAAPVEEQVSDTKGDNTPETSEGE